MEKIKNFLKCPPIWFVLVTFCLTILFSGISIALVVIHTANVWYAYIIYAFSAIFLGYFIYLVVIFSPNIKTKFIEILNKFSFTRKIYISYGFRTTLFSCMTLFLNICFGVFELTMSIISSSIWYGALGAYHLILCFTRFGIVLREYKENIRKKKNTSKVSSKIKTYHNTGICILITNIALMGAIVQMMFSQRAFVYAGIMIYVVALYAFWKLTLAILGIIKASKYQDYAIQSFRNLNLTDALVSLFALQTALIETFGTSESNLNALNIITGSFVILATTGIGIYMIVKGNIERKKLKNAK